MALKIYASMNYAPADRFQDALTGLVAAGIDGFHFDIPTSQQGQPNPFPPEYIDDVARWLSRSHIVVDVRLTDPSQTDMIMQYAKTSAQRMTIPLDSFSNDRRKLVECIRQMKSFDKKRAGVTIKMNQAESLRDYGLMTVVKHFYIQGSNMETNSPLYPAISQAVQQIAGFRKRFEIPDLELVVEGNIPPQKAAELDRAGAEVIVIGSSLFRAGDYSRHLASLRYPSTAAGRR
jgi:pentose-5-phosphate-3-epimerase